MESILKEMMAFLPFIVYGVVIALVVGAIRSVAVTVADKAFGYDLKKSVIWKKMVLSSLPPILGGLGAWLMDDFQAPEQFMGSVASKVVFGMFVGYMSSHVFYALKKFVPEFIKSKLAKLKG